MWRLVKLNDDVVDTKEIFQSKFAKLKEAWPGLPMSLLLLLVVVLLLLPTQAARAPLSLVCQRSAFSLSTHLPSPQRSARRNSRTPDSAW